DLENPYVTYHNDYIETGWWIFKQLWDRGMIYQDYRSTPHSPGCGTSLSDHDVGLAYADNDPVPPDFVKSRVHDSALLKMGHPRSRPLGDRTAIVAWTTTPWTLPGNTALAVKPDADYGMYAHEGDILVLATELAPRVLGEDAKPMLTIKGEGL